jgi:hypothetical protein
MMLIKSIVGYGYGAISGVSIFSPNTSDKTPVGLMIALNVISLILLLTIVIMMLISRRRHRGYIFAPSSVVSSLFNAKPQISPKVKVFKPAESVTPDIQHKVMQNKNNVHAFEDEFDRMWIELSGEK